MTNATYIEDMSMPRFMEEMSAAINTSAKHTINPQELQAVWSQKYDDSLRSKIMSLARRKRGQWAAFAKHYFEIIFLPNVVVQSKKAKAHKGEDDDDEPGDNQLGDEHVLSSAVRMDRFEDGLRYTISRSTLPNGTCCLAVTDTRRSTDR